MNAPTHKPGQQTERPWWHRVWHGAAGWTVKDARGGRVQLLVNAVPGFAARARIGLTQAETRHLRRHLLQHRAIGAIVIFLVLYLGIGFIVSLMVDASGVGDAGLEWWKRGVFFASLIIATVTFRWGLGGSRLQLREAILGLHRCASCGYSLKGIPREDDGCTVCPECAAAWRLPESGTP